VTAVELYPIERRIFAPPERMRVSEWAERYRRLRAGATARPGPYRLDLAPYAREILDSYLDPHVEEVTMMFGAQCGKSTIAEILVGYVVDQDPSPIGWLMPREDDYHLVHGTRILPMIEDSPRMSSHLTGRADDISQEGIQFDSCRLYYMAARSTASMKGRTIRVLIRDEIDEMPDTPQGDPLSMSLHRTNTYSGRRKIVNSSTPTTPSGKVAKKWEQSDKRRWHVPCPHCEHYQVLTWKHVRWEGFTEPELARDAAHLVCESCTARIDEGQRVEMVRRGVWVPEGATVDEAGVVHDPNPPRRHRGYHLPTINSPLITLGELVERSLNEDEADFTRQMLAEPYDVKADGVDVGAIRERIRDDHKRGEVPKEATLLTAGIDVQGHKLGLFYVVRAWAPSGESWLVAAGRSRDWSGVEEAVLTTQYGAAARLVSMAFVDSGDGNRIDEVYDFCRHWRTRTTPTKGRDRIERGKPFLVNQIDRAPNGRVLPGGLQLRTVNTLFFKDMLAQYVAGERQGWHLHNNDDGALEQYFEHMLAERRVEKDGKVRWELKPGVRRNDWWDCEVLALAAWYSLVGATGARNRRVESVSPSATAGAAAADAHRSAQRDAAPGRRFPRGNWIRRRDR
jgi:phage terminase large subunit GpA-like protein